MMSIVVNESETRDLWEKYRQPTKYSIHGYVVLNIEQLSLFLTFFIYF